MYLKNIKLAGFKSFVDATTVPIKSNMNGIVGPNGCGKSNIIDAVRWVIGELSAKQLRGTSMSDVIFNGTTSRKPVGKAQVELHFDNTAGRLSGEHAKFSEIAIRREVFREGQSNYYINGTACRRRDILDLFYGTGLGPRSYSIIEQGMISRLIEAKPEDMRNHLEEAAGISKYKDRRKETENRMKRTQENLDRLNDLRDEIEKQLRHLKRQANSAERYKVLKQEEREVNAQMKALQWQTLEADANAVDTKIQQQTVSKESLKAELGRIDTEMEKARLALTEATEAHHQAQKAYYSHAAEVARIEQRIQSTQQEMGRWQQELSESDELWEELNESSVEHETQAAELSQEMNQLKPQSEQLIQQSQQAHNALLDAEHAMKQWEQQNQQYQQRYTDNQKQFEVARTQQQYFTQQISDREQQVASIKDALAQQSIDELRHAIDPLHVKFSDMQTELANIRGTIDDTQSKITDQRQQNNTILSNINVAREGLQTMQGRLASLEALQESALQDDHSTVSQWLAEHELAKQPRLGKVLRVSDGWELAVETVLSGYFDAVCVDDIERYSAEVANFSEGQLTLISKGEPVYASANFVTLASKINSEWPLANWLNGIYVADNATEAMARRDQLANYESIITPEGFWVGKNWLRVAKSVDRDNSVLLREQAIQQLTAEINTEKALLKEKEYQLQQGEQLLTKLEQQREEQHQHAQSINQQIAGHQAQIAEKEAELKAMIAEQTRLQESLKENQHRLEHLREQAKDNQQKVLLLERQTTELQSELRELQQQREKTESSLNEKRNYYQAAKQRVDEYDIRVSSTESQLGLLQQTIHRARRQLEQLSERRSELQHQLADVDGPLDQLREELQGFLEKQSVLEKQLHAAADHLEGCNEQIATLDTDKEKLGTQLSEIDQQLEQSRMERQAITIRQSTIDEQLQEADINLQSIVESMPEAANMAEWEQRSQKLANQITRLGPINLAAIDEHESLTERKEYIDKQHADLSEALTVLHDAIRKIDRETKQKFKDTYERLNKEFSELFPRVFGGGSACLELEEGEDLLTSGVLVKAQPPGKKNSSIHMLSGGEKALTALALVFSFFQLNPAPFCILDEVDAPLDDLNVGRFCRLIKEMSDNTQFIIISHNKVTIESVDQLMGVTMQEPGVSRLVSVDIEEAVSMAEA